MCVPKVGKKGLATLELFNLDLGPRTETGQARETIVCTSKEALLPMADGLVNYM